MQIAQKSELDYIMQRKPMRSSLKFGGVMYSSASTLAGSGLTPSLLNSIPQKEISFLPRKHLGGLNDRPAFEGASMLCWTARSCSSLLFAATIRSSWMTCALPIWENIGQRATFCSACECESPIVRRLYQYSLSLAWNTVRWREFSASSICQKADFKSIFEKTLATESFALMFPAWE